jgi:DnaJ family protein C protein 7
LSQCTDAVKFICLKIEALIAWNHLPEAIEYTTKIQKLYNENPDFLYWTARLLTYNGQTDKGKQFLREAINMDPDNVNYQKAWKIFGKMQKQKVEANEVFTAGNYKEAIEKFTECLELD